MWAFVRSMGTWASSCRLFECGLIRTLRRTACCVASWSLCPRGVTRPVIADDRSIRQSVGSKDVVVEPQAGSAHPLEELVESVVRRAPCVRAFARDGPIGEGVAGLLI